MLHSILYISHVTHAVSNYKREEATSLQLPSIHSLSSSIAEAFIAMHFILLSLPILLHLFSTHSSSNLIPFQPNISILDFGRIIQQNPSAILNPNSPKEISQLIGSIFSSKTNNNITIAQRGAAHSTYGQSQALGGIIINMTLLPAMIQVEKEYVDVGGGVLWVDLLNETLKQGLTPRSWTDYLYLTIGGTLSVSGISGQAFKYGPQISNVIELDVITGKGEFINCSEEKDSDLFYGVLGGLGQLGIIIRARIKLQSAPKMVKWVKILYKEFEQFINDQESLIYCGEVDYLEGFIELQKGNSSQEKSRGSAVSYLIEFVIYYDDIDVAQKGLDEILPRLRYDKSTAEIADASYFEFLNRVRKEELELGKLGLWEVSHPWINILIPRAQIKRFKDLLLETIADANTSGPIIIYPILRHKWNPKMSSVLPQVDAEEDVIYVVSALRSAPPTCARGTPCLDAMLLQNQRIIDIATSSPKMKQNPLLPDREKEEKTEGMGAKQYMPYLQNEMQWKAHFGEKWERFKDLKNRFDPLHILAPGQRIFQRK